MVIQNAVLVIIVIKQILNFAKKSIISFIDIYLVQNVIKKLKNGLDINDLIINRI